MFPWYCCNISFQNYQYVFFCCLLFAVFKASIFIAIFRFCTILKIIKTQLLSEITVYIWLFYCWAFIITWCYFFVFFTSFESKTSKTNKKDMTSNVLGDGKNLRCPTAYTWASPARIKSLSWLTKQKLQTQSVVDAWLGPFRGDDDDDTAWGLPERERERETVRERAWEREIQTEWGAKTSTKKKRKKKRGETELSFSSLLSMMNQLRRGHLTPVTSPARHNYLRGEDGRLAGELCTAPSEIGRRLKIISVTGPVFVALSNLLSGCLWSARCVFFVNRHGYTA